MIDLQCYNPDCRAVGSMRERTINLGRQTDYTTFHHLICTKCGVASPAANNPANAVQSHLRLFNALQATNHLQR